MALRVLLADESSTIKKVFQLALQDFAVEVRPVNIGVDVAMVAKAFKPDIVFADVLLQKKNGYDVCAELKADPGLNSLPVVLMWSGFMELDEDKFQASQANAQLEKPFDVQALRKLVAQLVPRTQSQNLSQFLTFPKTPPEAENQVEALELSQPKVEEDFTAVPIPKMKGQQNDKYRINLRPEELDPNHIPVDFDMPDDEHEEEAFTMRESNKKTSAPPPPLGAKVKAPPIPDMMDEDEEMVSDFSTPPPIPTPAAKTPAPAVTAPSHAPAPAAAAPQVPQMSAEQIERIIRQQSAEVIESVVWKVIPELAKQIIERELNKLLKERDSHPY